MEVSESNFLYAYLGKLLMSHQRKEKIRFANPGAFAIEGCQKKQLWHIKQGLICGLILFDSLHHGLLIQLLLTQMLISFYPLYLAANIISWSVRCITTLRLFQANLAQCVCYFVNIGVFKVSEEGKREHKVQVCVSLANVAPHWPQELKRITHMFDLDRISVVDSTFGWWTRRMLLELSIYKVAFGEALRFFKQPCVLLNVHFLQWYLTLEYCKLVLLKGHVACSLFTVPCPKEGLTLCASFS